MNDSLKNRWIWITGSSSGIGEEIAKRLLNQGNRLILTARSRDKLSAIQALAPDRIWILEADLSLPECAAALRTNLAQITSHLDTVILNAGNCEYIDVDQIDIDAIERVTQTNYLGFARCVYACMPLLMKSEHKPHLVGVSSASAFYGLPRAEAYGASKAAIAHFLQSLRVDLYSKGIDVSVVYPGFVDTPLTRKNDFPMPWIQDSTTAVDLMLDGIAKRKHEISFPRPLIWSLKFLAALPSKVAVKLAQRMVRKSEAD